MNKGDLIGNRYRLERAIGQGGSGRIWLAQDVRLDRRVAIKFLLARDAYHRVRYARRVALEAKIAASIQHRNVVQIFDFGTHHDQIPYIVMEALTGFSLGEAFDASVTFSLDELIHIMGEVLRGLAAVHDAGIVHRDLKPENIFLIKEGRGKLSPKLLDFGISRSLEPEARRSAVTTTEGMIIGTPQYMSPEQARGDANIDKRTDIYSIGTIMFETFVGLVPFPADNISQLLVAILQRDAPSLCELAPQLGAPLCAVVDKALKKDREQRYAHAAEMHEALLAAAQLVPAELDRHAAIFPPDTIRKRGQSKRPRLGGDDNPPLRADAAHPDDAVPQPRTAQTVKELAGRQRPVPMHLPSAMAPVEPREEDLLGELPEPMGPASELEFATSPIATRDLRNVGPARYALTFGAIAALSLGVAVAALIVLRDRSAAPVGQGMIVVQAPSPAPTAAPDAAAAPDTTAQGAAGSPPAAPTAPSDAVRAEPEPEPAAPKRSSSNRARKRQGETDPQLMASGVASAFSRQKTRVIDCLNKHPDEVEGSQQLTVRVSLDERGRVSHAELLPERISSQPVGSCVKAAVAKMSFPRPDHPMTFRVPLTWRRK